MRVTWRRSVGAAVVAALLLGACGGDDDDPDGSGAGTGGGGGSTTASTQPPASDAAAVRPYLQDLLRAWDEAMTPILSDPRTVAEDPEHDLRRELAESFTDDSPYVRDLGEFLEGYISQNTGVHPGASGLAQETTLLDFTRTPDEDHLSFTFCSFSEGPEFALSEGTERAPSVGVTQGAGDATRVEGRWRLHRLQQLGVDTKPAGTPNPCPSLATGEGAGS